MKTIDEIDIDDLSIAEFVFLLSMSFIGALGVFCGIWLMYIFCEAINGRF